MRGLSNLAAGKKGRICRPLPTECRAGASAPLPRPAALPPPADTTPHEVAILREIFATQPQYPRAAASAATSGALGDAGRGHGGKSAAERGAGAAAAGKQGAAEAARETAWGTSSVADARGASVAAGNGAAWERSARC